MSFLDTKGVNNNFWLVGAVINDTDQVDRFIAEGIWENGYSDKYLDKVKSMAVGDRIAIKAAYTQKQGLPFDNHGNVVSCMSIKAVGTITSNAGDGRSVSVLWKKMSESLVWYFYTNRATVWKVNSGNWASDALIRFVFEGQPQDFGRYINHPYWFDRYGDFSGKTVYRYGWTRFYATLADNLLAYRDDRTELLRKLYKIAEKVSGFSHLKDKFADGSTGKMLDICPFTVMGIFNRGISEKRRKEIASEFKSLFKVGEPVPACLDGIPTLNNMTSRFFWDANVRGDEDINILWDVFYKATIFADGGDDYDPSSFIDAYNKASELQGVGWNLSMGLFWIRPWAFPTLDEQSRNYITGTLGIDIPMSGPKGRCTAKEYLLVKESLESVIQSEDCTVNSFPELSTVAGGREVSSDMGWLVQKKLTEFKAMVQRSFPGFKNVSNPTFCAEEINYKRKASEEIIEMLDQDTLAGMIAAGEYSELIKLLRSVGSKTNLLYMGTPSKGDLAPLNNSYSDETRLCKAFFELLWGEGESVNRLDTFYNFITAAELPVKWATATYFLFLVHPSTEMYVKPGVVKWLLDFFCVPMKYETAPSGRLYGEILSLCREIASQLSSWGVTDMIDVHSLIWAAYRAPAEVDSLSEPELELELDSEPLPAVVDVEEELSVNPVVTLDSIHSLTGYNREWIGRAVAALRDKGQCVFYGPPGTGKTFLAEKIARHIIGGGYGFCDLVQFHPSYSYEDFIEGLRPVVASSGLLSYELVAGRFKEFCSKARLVNDPCVLIVDEINRANLSRVFGELMYLLEYRDKEILLAGSKEKFFIPKNVFIIGTMNTADRSIALVDHALRRRFAFVHMMPDYSVLSHFHKSTGFRVAGLVSVLNRVNKDIADRNYFIGVSFFLKENISTSISNVWLLEIEPYLEEYFFDRPEVVLKFKWEAVQKEITGLE